ncbi:hypothetical protein GLOIN_2v860310 [Rhizophagus irregularis DAOM 181602=DAOM 197198]|uniref:Uncharacterized protein n=1 Tax=Rhizophagus irregularis (strain DAOM 181602 / DAOM 197198 / MUCL 43194) TaxID=747089 RepID=A0A2P4QGH6_RHIID|nr:hypothetical protein GLOIN_2v860310 [Rhizophagus irregularis DAOM 181602=DAOM 197198]POG76728.1 hypothetical protein GLOIN_2v860310 [Rhizophagus irregularis DAOM 181602=DAOM 197198]|eukprot:XP_025183594.1 hypothetical protein GLOIN_2v860310 [Rhizophagus irregularis DAOM 181602=DAOM 197198]
MTYKFNPDCTIPYNKGSDDGNEPIAEEVKSIGVNVNNNEYDGQKDLTSEEEIPGDDTYTATTQSQRSSLSNPVAESNNNNPITDQYSSSDKASPTTTQSQPVSKLPMNAQMLVENEQTLRLPPLAPKPSISVLPSIVRSNYQPSQELLNSSIGGGVIRGNNQPQPQSQAQPSQQMYDNAKIRTSSASIPSLQPLPTIDTSLSGNVNKIRQQLIPLQTSNIHNTPTSIPTSPQQTWPSSFSPFYMSPQPGEAHYTTIFENTFFDPTSQSTQHQHHHTSTASTNDYNNAVLNDLQQHNDNGSLFHRMNGNQQDNNMIDWDYRNM